MVIVDKIVHLMDILLLVVDMVVGIIIVGIKVQMVDLAVVV